MQVLSVNGFFYADIFFREIHFVYIYIHTYIRVNKFIDKKKKKIGHVYIPTNAPTTRKKEIKCPRTIYYFQKNDKALNIDHHKKHDVFNAI